MSKEIVYSNSLKRMISFKLLPSINPQDISIKNPNQSKTTEFLKNNKTDRQMKKMREKLIEQRRQDKSIEHEVDNIIRKMTEDGSAHINNNKVKRRGKYNHFRIISEPDEPKVSQKIQLPPVMQNRLPTNPGTRIKTEVEQKKLKRNLSERKKNEDTEIVNVGRYLKHYRQGMSSLKTLKHKKQHY